MNKPKKIYVVACLHGDELFGLKILAHLRGMKAANIDTFVAHPEAIAKKRRFIESDLNRSFHPAAPPTKETSIASHIREEIDGFKPDLIIDIHSVQCPVGLVAILAQDNSQLLQLAAQLGMERSVIMPEHIAKDSLIGSYPERALSLEFGIGLRSDALARDVAEAIVEVSEGRVGTIIAPIPTYCVARQIANDEFPGEELENYGYHRGLKGYPFLVGGSDAYTDFRGFLAERRTF